MPSASFLFAHRLSLAACGACLLITSSTLTAADRAADGIPAGETRQAKSGPWGVIEYDYIYIEATDELISNVQMPNAMPRWVFPGATESTLRLLFEKAALPSAMITRLLDKKQMVQRAESLTVFPMLADLEAMTPAMRTVVYEPLALSPENEFHQNPVTLIGGVEPWLRDARIRDVMKEKIRRMAYPRGLVQVFSDVQALLSSAQSDTEVRRILKLTTRVRTLMARVRVTPKTDFNQLYEYWSDQRRARDIRPFLESIAERPAEAALDLVHLLPRAPRRLLYSYPSIDLAARGRLPDCHWSSLNFFKLIPQDYYLDSRLAAANVIANFTPVVEPYTFGDVLFFMNAEGGAVHSCVYLADDIVYTKNGENLLSPWILMHLDDMHALYAHKPGITMQAYRRKPITN